MTASLPKRNAAHVPFLGFGIGLRTVHYDEIRQLTDTTAGIDWFGSVATGLDAVGEIDTNKITIGAPGLGGPEIIGTEPGYPGLPGVAQRALSLP